MSASPGLANIPASRTPENSATPPNPQSPNTGQRKGEDDGDSDAEQCDAEALKEPVRQAAKVGPPNQSSGTMARAYGTREIHSNGRS